VFNVCDQQFAGGAKGDGDADDRAAIQAAIDAASAAGGGDVIFPEPASFYKIITAINLASGVNLRGLGFRPEIKLVLAGSANMLVATSKSDIVIENLKINGNDATVTSGTCIRIDGSTRVKIRDCEILDAKAQGILVTGASSDVRIYENDFIDGSYQQIEVNGACFDFHIYENLFDGSAAFCTFVQEACHDFTFVGNRTYDSTLELVGVRYDCYNYKIRGNTAANTGDNGISSTGYQATIEANISYGNAGSGIWVYGSDTSVTGNICFNNSQGTSNRAGILVEPGSGGAGRNNTVDG
jgi:polygalacturonase